MAVDINESLENFSKALQIKTISYPETEKFDFDEYAKFISFLKETYPLVHEKLDLKIINDYALLYHWKTESDDLPIMLLAHYDVVPVNEGTWTHEPFDGVIKDGKVWGRGTIDDKNSIITIIETVEDLLKNDFKPKRDIYMAFGYDEEVMGQRGAKHIVEYLKKENMKFECILDEGGLVAPGSMMGIDAELAVIGIAEKSQCNYEIIFKGDQGHSSSPPKSTAIGKMSAFIQDVENHPRECRLTKPVEEMLKNVSVYQSGLAKMFMKNPSRHFSLIKKSMVGGRQTNALIRTTTAFTMAESGTAANVLPDYAKVVVNVRVLQGDTPEMITDWLNSFNHDFELKPLYLEAPSSISNIDSKAYEILGESIKETFGDIMITPYLMIGGTDSRQYSELSENIYRFTPFKLDAHEIELMHADDEYISIENFEKMLEFYEKFIKKMAG